MRYAICVAILTLGVSPAMASPLFSDDFESGVSGAKWEVMQGNSLYQILNGDSAHAFGTQSAKQVEADPYPYYMRSINGSHPSAGILTAGQKETLTTYMWDDLNNFDGSGNQIGAGVMLSDPSSSTGAANDFYQININSTLAAGSYPNRFSHYNWRTSTDGTFDSGVTRTQGWHKFQIVVNPYTGNTGDVQFYIDDILVGSGKRRAGSGSGYAMDEIRLGISIKSPASSFWYDNVNLSVVPEPAALSLLGLGVVLFLRRR